MIGWLLRLVSRRTYESEYRRGYRAAQDFAKTATHGAWLRSRACASFDQRTRAGVDRGFADGWLAFYREKRNVTKTR